MYTLAMKRAIQKGFLDNAYNKNMEWGYMGALSKISKAGDGMVYLIDICQGTDDLQNGVYICKVNTANGTRAMKILVSK